MKNHPLFPDKPDADVTAIHVTRFEAGRKAWSAEKFAAESLTDLSQVLDRYGGGLFELIGHGPHEAKGGKTASHGIVARQEYPLDGAPKPLNPSAAAPPPPIPAHVNGGGGGNGHNPSSDLISVLLTQAGEDRRAMMALMVKMTERPAPPPPPPPDNSALLAVIQGQTQMLSAAFAARGAPASGIAADPIKLVLDVFEVAGQLRAGAAESLAKAGASGELDLGKLADGVEKVIKVVRDAKNLAEDGAGPEQAAAAAAQAAAEAGG